MKKTKTENSVPNIIPKLHCIDSDGVRAVFLDDILVYSIQLSDNLHTRLIAVELHLTHGVRQATISACWGVTVRSVNSWISRFRKSGISGLQMKKRGAPVKITPQIRKRIFKLRAQRKKITEIARIVKVTPGRISQILSENKDSGNSPKLPVFETPQEAEQAELSEISDTLPKKEAKEENASPDDEAASSSEQEEKIEEEPQEIPVEPAPQKRDPLDRSGDRAMAVTGLLEDAEPIFADCEHVEKAGSLLALAVLTQTAFLDSAKKVYKTFGASFYGIHTFFCTMFLMAVQRINNPERLHQLNALKLGRLLGLDRCPCIKTIRAKLKSLAQRKKAKDFMNMVGKERMSENCGPDAVLYVDGHVKCYHGKNNVGKTFSTSKNRVVKGITDNWVNLGDGTPILCLPSSMNQNLSQILPEIIEAAQKICGDRRLTVGFDRGGASGETYEKLINASCDIIAYHKNPEPIDHSLFQPCETTINNRTYAYAPYEREAVIDVYKTDSKGQRRKTGRTVTMRELIIKRDDNGTTHVISTRDDLGPIPICGSIFNRWSQENFFKYMDSTYDFDHTYTYKTETIPEGFDRPNPEYTQLQKQQTKIRRRIASLIGRKLDNIAENKLDELADLHKGKKGAELKQLSQTLKATRQALKQTPKRISADDLEVLDPETRILTNTIKGTAYHIEGKLASIIRDVWPGQNGSERSIVEGFLKSTGSLKVEDQILRITFEPQSTEQRNNLLDHLCQEINAMEATYPRTNLKMIFETTPFTSKIGSPGSNEP